MKSEWQLSVEQLLAPLGLQENPFDAIDKLSKQLSQPDKKEQLRTYIKHIETALSTKTPLSMLAPMSGSEDVVRDYLRDLLSELKKIPLGSEPEELKPKKKNRKKENLLIAVDFDGTIVEHHYPEIGPPLPLAFEVLSALQQAGHRLMLYTCREDQCDETERKYLSEALDFCKTNGIHFVSANENRTEDDFRPKGGRKPYADVYIDDRNIGGFPGWFNIRKEILGQ